MDNIGFLIAYTTQFPKMYRFANLPKMPTKLHSEPDYDTGYASNAWSVSSSTLTDSETDTDTVTGRRSTN